MITIYLEIIRTYSGNHYVDYLEIVSDKFLSFTNRNPSKTLFIEIMINTVKLIEIIVLMVVIEQ